MPEPAFDAPDSSPPLPPAVTAPTAGKDAPTDSTGKAEGSPLKSIDDLVGPKGDLSVLEERKIGAEGGMIAAEDRRQAAFRARQERMIDAEGVTADDLHPWNAEKELNDRKTNLWEQFGSPGFVIAMLASTFTAMPMNSALNAGAAAMNAINAGDMDKYEKAFDAWKENSKLTLKRLDLEEKEFDQIGELGKNDAAAAHAKLAATLAQFHDKRKLAMLQAGLEPELWKAVEQQKTSKVELQKATDLIEENEIRRKIINANPNFKSGDPKKMAAAIRDADDTLTGADDKLTGPQLYMKKFVREHPDATSDEILEAAKKAATAAIGRSGGSIPALKAQRIQALKEAEPERDEGDIIRQVESEFTKAPQPKTFSNPEQKTLSVLPDLMKHLETLDAFSSATGTISGLVQRLGAEYGGVNDPAIIWQTAKRQAEAAVAELASGGRVSVIGLKHQLEQLPDDYKAARFGKYQVQEFMRDLRDKSQSELDIMEASGKKIPPEVIEKFAAIGVYPASRADKDPLLVLREDPSKVPTPQLTAMSRYMAALPIEDQRRIVAEAKRRLNAAQGGQ